MKKIYGIYFHGSNHASEQVKTDIDVGTLTSSVADISKLVKSHLPQIQATYGFIKEFTVDDASNKILVEKPSALGDKKFQAFILKRKGDDIIADTTNAQHAFFINGNMVNNIPVEKYDLTVIEI